MKFRRVGYFPLTLPRLAAYFSSDCEIRLFYEKCQDIPLSESFDMVFFTTMGSNLVRAKELAAEFRKNGVTTVAGGYSVGPLLDYCKENFDVSVIGDAEELIPRICEDFKQKKLEKVYRNPNPDLTTLLPPRFDLVDPKIVGEILPLEASRGCPNACDFCAVSNLYNSRFRKRSVSEVLNEFSLARKAFGKRLIYFTDQNFSADLSHAKAILKGLIGKHILWVASVDMRSLLDEEFLALARASGCMGLQVGLETLSRSALAEVNKNFAVKLDSRTLIRNAQNAGVPIIALLMFGFDADTPAIFKEMQTFLEEMHLPLAVAHPMTPIPGTRFHEKLLKENRLLPLAPSLADGLHVLYKPRNFSPSQLTEQYWRFNKNLLSLRSIVRRFLWPGFMKSPVSFLVLLITNFLARTVVAKKLPPGMYE